jgi:hypothetical protein
MTVLASADTHTLWEITLGMGVVVLGVVVVMMALLTTFVAEIERGAGRLLDNAGGVAGNTKWIEELSHTANALDDVLTEASVQRSYLNRPGARR